MIPVTFIAYPIIAVHLHIKICSDLNGVNPYVQRPIKVYGLQSLVMFYLINLHVYLLQ